MPVTPWGLGSYTPPYQRGPVQPPGGAEEGVGGTTGFGVGEGPVLALLDALRLPGVGTGICGDMERGGGVSAAGPPPHPTYPLCTLHKPW